MMNSLTLKFGIAVCLFSILSVQPPEANAGTILFEHTGSTDPLAEGWSKLQFSGVSVGPVVNDSVGGLDAWSVNDSGHQFGLYNQVITAAQIAETNVLGWHLRSIVRVVNTPDANDFSVEVGWRNGTTAFATGLGSASNGDPIVKLFGRSAITLTGFGPGYHQYDLIFDPAIGSASLFVDGILQDSGYTGVSQSPIGVLFGSGQTGSAGHGHYNLVQFAIGEISTVPEPSTLALFLSGALGLVGYCWQMKRKSQTLAGSSYID